MPAEIENAQIANTAAWWDTERALEYLTKS